jgi:hypothetical protein
MSPYLHTNTQAYVYVIYTCIYVHIYIINVYTYKCRYFESNIKEEDVLKHKKNQSEKNRVSNVEKHITELLEWAAKIYLCSYWSYNWTEYVCISNYHDYMYIFLSVAVYIFGYFKERYKAFLRVWGHLVIAVYLKLQSEVHWGFLEP